LGKLGSKKKKASRRLAHTFICLTFLTKSFPEIVFQVKL
jgi:hypothetical protein